MTGGRTDERQKMSGSFFEAFTPQEVARISAAGTRVSLPKGWSPIWETTPADKAYVILEGEVSVRRHGDEIARLGPGDIFGEAALVKHTLRTASVVALTELDLIHLSVDAISTLSREMPKFGQVLDEVVAQRVGGSAAQ